MVSPVLVTGAPRSGTTWLARLLAGSPGAALTGREPMNPRGRQYALAGTLSGWARLTDPTPRQARALRAAYRGLAPRVYSRYGHRQWAAPLPWSRVVVKDPFAMLSVPAIQRVTGARAVLVYRHPGAVLASYRRMGWSPDLEELRAVVDALDEPQRAGLPDVPEPGVSSPAHAMGVFWAVLHELAARDQAASAPAVPATWVSHAELAAGGPTAGRQLADALGLGWSDDMERELARESAARPGGGTGGSQLHRLDRAPAEVAQAWRAALKPAEVDEVSAAAGDTWERVEALRLPLG